MKLVSLIRTTFVALMFTASAAQAGIIVSFDTSSTDVNVGDTFTVDVLATTENPLTDAFLAFDIGFDFDDTLLSLDNSAVGSGFLAGLAVNDIAGFAALPIPVSGVDILLASLTFTATAAGDLTLDLSAGLFSALGFVEFDSTALNVSVNDVEVSAPAAISLLALAGMLMFARRRV